MIRIVSYNLFGVKNVEHSEIPAWSERQRLLEQAMTTLIEEESIDVFCFQEVNSENLPMIRKIAKRYSYNLTEMFPMMTLSSIVQYNLILVKKGIEILSSEGVPHFQEETLYEVDLSKQLEFLEKNEGLYSDYRTTSFCWLRKGENHYYIGNIHMDHRNVGLKIQGLERSLNKIYGLKEKDIFGVVIGDMNTVVHLGVVRGVLEDIKNIKAVSRARKFDYLTDHSYHGYGLEEPMNPDFCFVEEGNERFIDYRIIKQPELGYEGSDHRPIRVTIYDEEIPQNNILISKELSNDLIEQLTYEELRKRYFVIDCSTYPSRVWSSFLSEMVTRDHSVDIDFCIPEHIRLDHCFSKPILSGVAPIIFLSNDVEDLNDNKILFEELDLKGSLICDLKGRIKRI